MGRATSSRVMKEEEGFLAAEPTFRGYQERVIDTYACFKPHLDSMGSKSFPVGVTWDKLASKSFSTT
jgi:hypothetical protein